MLNFLRKSVSSWVGVGILVLAVGALVFTLFQPTGPGAPAGATGPVLASVGDAAVTESQFVRTIDRAVQQEREANPAITAPDFLDAGGGDLVMAQMIAGEAIAEFGRTHGILASRRMVDGEIASIPALQVNGRFDEPTFRRLLAQQRITEEELRDGIAKDLKRRQLIQPILLGTTVPRGMAEPYAALLLEVRRGSILPVPSAAMPAPPAATPAQLAEFHKANAAAYTLPERRAFRFAEIDTAAIAARAAPSDADVAAYYKANAAEFGGVERRVVNQVILRDEARARAFAAQVASGTAFAAAAAAQGFAPADTALGEQTRDALAKATSPAVADAAFALAPGTVGAPVQSPLGWHMLEVTRVIPAAARPLSAVAPQIAERLREEKLGDLLATTVADAEDRLTGGESLTDVARSLGAAVQTAPAIAADGRMFDADYSVTVVQQPLLPKVFAADPSDGAQVVEMAPGRFALLEVTDVVAPALVPLAAIRADVAAAWAIKARSDAARREADRIAAAIGKGATLAQAVGTANLPPPQSIAVRRLELTQMAQQGQQVPPPVLMLLSTPAGKARVIAAPGGQGWFVVKVDDVRPGNLAQAPPLAEAVRQSLRLEAGNELADTFVRAIERDVGVTKQPAAIAAATRRLTGAAVGE